MKRNRFLNQRALAETIGLARSTVSNFLAGKPLDRVVFEEICDRLSLTTTQFDWGDALDVASFYGHSEVLSELD